MNYFNNRYYVFKYFKYLLKSRKTIINWKAIQVHLKQSVLYLKNHKGTHSTHKYSYIKYKSKLKLSAFCELGNHNNINMFNINHPVIIKKETKLVYNNKSPTTNNIVYWNEDGNSLIFMYQETYELYFFQLLQRSSGQKPKSYLIKQAY